MLSVGKEFDPGLPFSFQSPEGKMVTLILDL